MRSISKTAYAKMAQWMLCIKGFLRTALLQMRMHYWAIIAASLIGLAVVAPQIAFICDLGSSYQGLYIMKADVEPYYLARIHEAYRGDISVSPFTYEGKYTVPPGTMSFAEPMLAVPGIIFDVSVTTLALIYKFILPFLIALLIYALFFKLTRNKAWSVAAACAVMLGYNYMYAQDVLHVLRFDASYPEFWGSLTYTRPVYPQFSAVFFFLYLNLLYDAITKARLKWYAYLGIVFGMTFYIYLYDFTFILTLNAVAAVIFLARKDRKAFLKMCGATALGMIIGSYFIFNLIQVIHSPYYAVFAVNEKMALSHMPIASVAGCIALALFLAYFFLKKRLLGSERTQADWFFLGLLATAFVVINQQVVTGHLLQEGHYHWYFNVPIFILTLLYISWNISIKRRTASLVIVALVIAASFWAATVVDVSSYLYWRDSVAFDQRYMPLMQWFNAHSEPQSVIFADEDISALVPVYTFDNVVWEYMAINYLIPEDRQLFTPDAILKSGFVQNVHRYRVDYVVWDTVKDPSWKMDQYKILREVYETGGMKVYAFK